MSLTRSKGDSLAQKRNRGRAQKTPSRRQLPAKAPASLLSQLAQWIEDYKRWLSLIPSGLIGFVTSRLGYLQGSNLLVVLFLFVGTLLIVVLTINLIKDPILKVLASILVIFISYTVYAWSDEQYSIQLKCVWAVADVTQTGVDDEYINKVTIGVQIANPYPFDLYTESDNRSSAVNGKTSMEQQRAEEYFIYRKSDNVFIYGDPIEVGAASKIGNPPPATIDFLLRYGKHKGQYDKVAHIKGEVQLYPLMPQINCVRFVPDPEMTLG